ncbi:hypothetical protein BD410DRAFT_787674 [Rickenella mellea]|uniref:DUF6533 domain-containing protein n=1 Tax=Rickenella mellea TaxID=50990 RepID=A0A4Y7Q6Q0_9AGAM|nr:hypothetical protein BD410DRAFT_787674 [Rickenella mellea]
MAVPQSTISAYNELIATNYVGVASYTFLIYDHILTFGDEVEYIWKGHKGPIIYLFFVNRYFFDLAFILNLNAYLNPAFTPDVCRRFVRFEGSCVLIGLGLAGLMMMFRVNALYGGQRIVLAMLGVLWLTMVGVFSWLLAGGQPVIHPAGIHGCSLIFSESLGSVATLSSALPLIFDSAVLMLTLRRTAGLFKSRMAGHIVRILVRDGILYYSVIFTCNLVLTIMIATAPPGNRNIMGQLTQLMTVTMMSRITIHLRVESQRKRDTAVFLDSVNTESRGPVRFRHSYTAASGQTVSAGVGTPILFNDNDKNVEERGVTSTTTVPSNLGRGDTGGWDSDRLRSGGHVSFAGEDAYEMGSTVHR